MEIRVREWVGMKMRGREGFLRREGEAGSCGGRECEKGFQTHGGEWRKAGSIVGFFLLFLFGGNWWGGAEGVWVVTWHVALWSSSEIVVRICVWWDCFWWCPHRWMSICWKMIGALLAFVDTSYPIFVIKKKSLSSIWRFANSYWFLSPPFLKAIPNSFSLLFLFFA